MQRVTDATNLDSWTAVISESSAVIIDKLTSFVDFADLPNFFEFASEQWHLRNRGSMGPWKFLLDSHIILTAVGHPTAVSTKQAIELTRFALNDDPLFDTKLIRRIVADRLWPEEIPPEEVMRMMEVFESLDEPHRLSMTLLKFAKFPERKVQSKVAKILGRCIDNVSVIEELFQNPDGRVRANLLEGIGRRDSIEMFQPLIERAAKDQQARVSSLALALRSRAGHAGSAALIKLRAKSPADSVRKSAEFSIRTVAGEPRPLATDAPSLSALLRVVDPEPAVAAAVEEVHCESKGHPDE